MNIFFSFDFGRIEDTINCFQDFQTRPLKELRDTEVQELLGWCLQSLGILGNPEGLIFFNLKLHKCIYICQVKERKRRKKIKYWSPQSTKCNSKITCWLLRLQAKQIQGCRTWGAGGGRGRTCAPFPPFWQISWPYLNRGGPGHTDLDGQKVSKKSLLRQNGM